ncbi:hypothetical protein [Streptomyces boninensis]|uniref:hypothetical protein n=1 Tax=Streptomyces boninensis TaxID=2039455 RepID=UPI003B20D1C1
MAGSSKARAALAAVLIVLGCVLAPLAVVSAWASGVVGDTDRYVDTVAPLASDKDVQDAVAKRAADAAAENIDLATLLEGVAPADRPRLTKALGKLDGPLQEAVRSLVRDKARAVVASDGFEQIWKQANRTSHAAVIKALTGKGGDAVKLDDEGVTVDLGPVVEQVRQRLVDDGFSAVEKQPAPEAEFTVIKGDKVAKARTGLRLLEAAGTWLPILALLLIAGGVLLAARRRRALAAAAAGVALAVLLLGIGLLIFRGVYLDALPGGVSRPAAESVYEAVTRLLRTTVRMVVAVAAVTALAAWLTGSGRRAGLVRNAWESGIRAIRTTADDAGLRTGPVGPWVSRHRAWITRGLVIAAVLVYVLWSYPTALVVLALVLALLFALAVVSFLAAGQDGPPPSPSPERTHRTGGGTAAG